MPITKVIDVTAVILALLVAIIGHEIMHGRMALHYGDNTAKDEGRLSPNPISHIDPVGTIILPLMLYLSSAGFMFGWAKPVPIDMRKVINKGGFFGGFQVSLAGIYYNFFLAFLAFILLKTLSFSQNSLFDLFLGKFLFYTLIYNIVLGIFNLFPIPPLDGSKALMFMLYGLGFYKAGSLIEKYSNYGMILLLVIVATPLSQIIFAPINNILQYILSL